MDAKQFAEIKARYDKSTQGEWIAIVTPLEWTVNEKGGAKDHDKIADVYSSADDTEFIAHARQDVPDLLAEVERQAAEIERLTDVIAMQQRQIERKEIDARAQYHEIERLRAELNLIACAAYPVYDIVVAGHDRVNFVRVEIVQDLCAIAREALKVASP